MRDRRSRSGRVRVQGQGFRGYSRAGIYNVVALAKEARSPSTAGKARPRSISSKWSKPDDSKYPEMGSDPRVPDRPFRGLCCSR